MLIKNTNIIFFIKKSNCKAKMPKKPILLILAAIF